MWGALSDERTGLCVNIAARYCIVPLATGWSSYTPGTGFIYELKLFCIIHTDIVRTSQETHHVFATEPNQLMLCGETVAVCCENRTEHTDTVCGQSVPHRRHITTRRAFAPVPVLSLRIPHELAQDRTQVAAELCMSQYIRKAVTGLFATFRKNIVFPSSR
jgi:hypothetical protein